jgi:hypothetical protein
VPLTGSLLHRIRRPVFIWALLALVAELAAERVLDQTSAARRTASVRLVALIPLVPALLFMLALVRMIQRMDELQKRICLDSAFVAFIATLLLTFVFAGLEQAAIYQPRWDSVGTTMLALWAGAYAYASWKYQ